MSQNYSQLIYHRLIKDRFCILWRTVSLPPLHTDNTVQLSSAKLSSVDLKSKEQHITSRGMIISSSIARTRTVYITPPSYTRLSNSLVRYKSPASFHTFVDQASLLWTSISSLAVNFTCCLQVDRHPQFRQSRCLFIVRTDGGWIDFSYQKCLRSYIRHKYPTYAEKFIKEHYKRSS